jgi:hypothetical protein
LLFPDGYDESKPIEITWRDETELEIKDCKAVIRDRIVWFHEEHDIALIRCESPYDDVVNAWVLLGRDRPKHYAECKCFGFLSNLHCETGKQRRKTPTRKFGAFSENALTVDVDDLSVSLENDELWAGFSGSPVFSFSGDKLVAIARTVNIGENGAGLVASFISPALDAMGGRDQVRLRDVPVFFVPSANVLWSEKLRPNAIKMLQAGSGVYKAIKKIYQDKVDKGADISNEAELVDAL